VIRAIFYFEMLEEIESGPARNRTTNPLTKSPLADEATAGHDGLPLEIPSGQSQEDPP
jgi:hypothetical protein